MSFTIATVIGGIATVLVFLLTQPKKGTREHKLVNRADQPCVDLADLPGLCRLAPGGSYVVQTFRQSQNPHQDDRYLPDADSALKAAMTTFKRAKIDLVSVMDSTDIEFSFQRAVPDYTGRSEGRKVRWVEIHRIAPATE